MGKVVRTGLIFAILVFGVMVAAGNALAAWEIYTYDSGDFLAGIFNAMTILTGPGDGGGMLRTLIKIAVLLGLITSLLIWLQPGDFLMNEWQTPGAGSFLVMIRQLILAAVAVYLLMVPKADVMIVDRVDPAQTQVVESVPFFTAVVAHGSSRFGDKIASTLDDLITDEDSVKFRNGGMAMGARYLNDILDISPPGAPADYAAQGYVPVSAVMGEYFTRCIFPNFASLPGSDSTQARGLRRIMTSPFLLGAFTEGIYRSPETVFNAQFVSGEAPDGTTCANAAGQILETWRGDVFDEWLKQFNYRIFGDNALDPGGLNQSQALFARYFGWSSVGDWKDNIIQIAAINSVRTEVLFYQLAYGAGGASEAMMEKKTGEGWIYAARLLNRIVMTMRQLAEALVYGAALFLPVIFVIGGYSSLIFYVKVHLWLQLWVPMFVILNAFADHQLTRAIESALNNPAIPAENLGISFANVESLRTHASLILGYTGAFSWSIPTMAWAVLKGGEYAMGRAMATISSGSGGQGTAQSVGAEVGGGGRPQIAPVMQNPTMAGINYGHETSRTIAQRLGEMDFARDYHYEDKEGRRYSGQQMVRDGAQTSLARSWGTYAGMGGTSGIIDTESGAAERSKSDQEAFAEEAGRRGYQSLGEFQKVLSTMDYGQKGQVIDDWAERYGGTRREAAQSLAVVTGDQNFIRAAEFKASQETAGGRQGYAALKETMGQIGTYSIASTIDTMKDYGYTPEQFGGFKGFADAAKTVAGLEALKGGRLTKGEIVGMQETGLLSEAGRMQAAERLAGMFGGSVKDYQKQLSTWEGINAYVRFNELQQFANGRGIELKELMAAHHRGIDVAVGAEQAGQWNLPGPGQYRLAWDDDQGFVFTHQQSGEERQVGQFGRFGRETVTSDRTVRNFQDEDKSGFLMSRGTIIDGNTAFQMARDGDRMLTIPVTNEFMDDRQRDTQIGVLSSTLGKGLGAFVQRMGVYTTASNVSGGVSAGVGGGIIFKAQVGGSGSVSAANADRRSVNLLTQQYDSLIRNSLKEVHEMGLNTQQTRTHLSEKISDFTDALYRRAVETSTLHYGATAPGKLMIDAAKGGMEGVKSFIFNQEGTVNPLPEGQRPPVHPPADPGSLTLDTQPQINLGDNLPVTIPNERLNTVKQEQEGLRLPIHPPAGPGSLKTDTDLQTTRGTETPVKITGRDRVPPGVNQENGRTIPTPEHSQISNTSPSSEESKRGD